MMKKEAIAKLLRSRKFLAWHPERAERTRFKAAAREEKKLGGIAELYTERHYAPTELAKAWGVSVETVRSIFRNEPGVLKIGKPGTKVRRGYFTLRIPEGVAKRVHGRLSA